MKGLVIFKDDYCSGYTIMNDKPIIKNNTAYAECININCQNKHIALNRCKYAKMLVNSTFHLKNDSKKRYCIVAEYPVVIQNEVFLVCQDIQSLQGHLINIKDIIFDHIEKKNILIPELENDEKEKMILNNIFCFNNEIHILCYNDKKECINCKCKKI